MYYDGEHRLESYQEVAKAAFGSIGGWVAFFFTAITLIGVPVLYLLLSGLNLHNVAMGTTAELTFPIWVIICASMVAVPFLFFKSLKEVGVLSVFGTLPYIHGFYLAIINTCFFFLGMLSTAIVIFIVLAVSVKEEPNQVDIHHDAVIWNMFPIALSSISFSFGKVTFYLYIGMNTLIYWYGKK
jgi:hypothetical protein